jgi:hypothetical protein
MKSGKILLTIAAAAGLCAPASAELTYTFNTDVEGFQNVSWQATAPVGWSGIPAVKQTHTAGAWQMLLTKEFSWGAGGGNANQQLEMQRLANQPNPRLAFDVIVDGTSFPAGAATWFQFSIVGNSDGSAGWTQLQNIFSVSGWHNADDPALLTMHFDYSFRQLGWQAGDTWFQLYTGANSDGAVPVNFYLDNVMAIPEPSLFALAGLGAALLIFRRK